MLDEEHYKSTIDVNQKKKRNVRIALIYFIDPIINNVIFLKFCLLLSRNEKGDNSSVYPAIWNSVCVSGRSRSRISTFCLSFNSFVSIEIR